MCTNLSSYQSTFDAFCPITPLALLISDHQLMQYFLAEVGVLNSHWETETEKMKPLGS